MDFDAASSIGAGGGIGGFLLSGGIAPTPKWKRWGVCKVDDFRGISLTSVVYKAMCSVLHRRLVHMVEEKQLVAEEQGGLRKGRGCRD